MVFEFDVGITTHELLHNGVVVNEWINVRVVADNHIEASLIACQMGACHGYVTECLYRE